MTREEIMQLNTDYLNDCESEHEMNELFYFVLELLKHEQESSCPYYVIDEDGHGLCKNHRLEQAPRTGHWEWVQYDYNPKIGNWHCSECRSIVVESVYKNEKAGIPLYKYCPNCRTKMQKSEEQEN